MKPRRDSWCSGSVGDYVEAVHNDRFGPIDFDRFHRSELPALLEERKGVFSPADARVVRPIGFQLHDGRAYTYLPSGDMFSVVEGCDDAQTVVVLSYESWCAFAWELRSCFALLYADELVIARGNFGQLVRWEPPLRVAIDGQPLYDVDDPAPVEDLQGRALDLDRTFTLDDPDDEIADFLHCAGYVHLRGVIDGNEVEALRAEVSAAVAAARADDRRSWWTTVEGREVCNRVNYLNDRSQRIAQLGSDERFTRIAALGGPELRDACDRLDGNSVVIKVPGASAGLADLPWHRDCGMGGHPVKCPMINVGIQLDPATAETGQLQMIPGSHRGTSRLPRPVEAQRLRVVALATEPGDVTVHFGHTLHAAPPPIDEHAKGRRALYLTFVPPLTFEMIGPGQGYNDVLFTRGEGRVQHVDQLQ
jgi:ectoine hydroxylase-related dioxygenase (phytanoyl-CoA dioxygenase family)